LLDKISVVINNKPSSQQLESLKLAIKVLPTKCCGIMFLPVDYPLIKLSTYKKIISCWKKNKTKIVVPSYNYRKGHPAIFPKKVYKKILNKKIVGGARSLINKKNTIYVCVDDENVIRDFDYLKDLKKYNFGGD
jgi:molybdenum cofactor cytidylyltransferase